MFAQEIPTGSPTYGFVKYCVQCEDGKVDDDRNPNSPCASCQHGKQPNFVRTRCDQCPDNQVSPDGKTCRYCTGLSHGYAPSHDRSYCKPCTDRDAFYSVNASKCLRGNEEGGCEKGSEVDLTYGGETLKFNTAHVCGRVFKTTPAHITDRFRRGVPDCCNLCTAGRVRNEYSENARCEKCPIGTFSAQPGGVFCTPG